MTFGAALALYTVLGFWAVPRVIRSQLLHRLPALTHRSVEVGRVQVNPFRWTLTVSNLVLKESSGARFASLERFHADLQAASLWRRALVLREVEVVHPYVEVLRKPDGSLNWANLIPTSSAATSGPPPRLELASLRLSGGEVVLQDQAIPGTFVKRLTGLDLQFTNFSTHWEARSVGTLRVTGDADEIITWSGDLGIHPLASAGTVRLEGLHIPRQGPYLQQATTAEVADGTLSLGIPYALSMKGEGLSAEITNGSIGLTDLAFRLPQATTPSLVLSELGLSGLSVSLGGKSLRIGDLVLRGGQLSVKRGSDGAVDVAQAIRPEFVEAAVKALHDLLAGWSVEVPEILAEQFSLRWDDAAVESVQQPAQLEALVERVQVQGLSNQTNRPVRVQARARWATNGAVTLAAEGTLLPATATVTMRFEHARLPVLQPYLDEFVNLNIQHGEASGRWTLEYNRKPGGPLITVEGGLEVQNFLAFDTLAGRDFLKWEELQLREVKAAWEPATLHLAEIHLRQPATSFVLLTNGLLNIQSLVKGGLPTNPPAGSASSSPRSLQLLVDRLTLTNASVYAADRTVPGEFSTTLERFSGFVTDLAWPLQKSRVELAGFVGARAPFTVAGWILPDPERRFLDMHVTTTNAEVIPFTPYAIKFVGYPLLKGRLTADVTYRVDGQQLQGENLILVDQLTLGPRASAQPLLDLPVKLGIALLKDRQGRITLNIPVKGSLEDPEFGVGKVVWQAVKGLFVKVATAPFKLLGSLFGGSEDEGQALQRVEFAAGATNLAPAATNQLERLVTALEKRPELLLVVRGGASPEEDGPALALGRLETRLQELRWAELAVTGTSEAERKPLTLSAEERGRLLGVLFTNTFPETIGVVSTNAVAAPGVTVDPAVSPKAALAAQEKFQARLLEQLQPAAEDLHRLRAARVEVVRTWLLSANRLTPERLVVPEPGNTQEPPVVQRVVEFSLE